MSVKVFRNCPPSLHSSLSLQVACSSTELERRPSGSKGRKGGEGGGQSRTLGSNMEHLIAYYLLLSTYSEIILIFLFLLNIHSTHIKQRC